MSQASGPRHARGAAVPSFAVAALAVLLAAAVPSSSTADDAAPAPAGARSLKDRLETIRRDSRKDFAKTAADLRALADEPMDAETRATWVRLSRVAALRTGDAALLKALAGAHDPFSTLAQGRLIVANGLIEIGDFAGADAELGRIDDLDHLNTRDRRRYFTLKARIAQLTGREDDEFAALGIVMREVPHWPSADCQGCHGDLKNPTVLPHLDPRRLWFTDRYVELLRRQGRGTALARETEARLAKDPNDLEARVLRFAALSALGSSADADKAIEGIEWLARQPEGTPSPRMIFAWP